MDNISNIYNKTIRSIMSFGEIFKENNDYNEKNVIGFMSFSMMVLTAIIDIVTGVVGVDMTIHEYIYNSFLIVTLGSFGISSLEKFSPTSKDK